MATYAAGAKATYSAGICPVCGDAVCLGKRLPPPPGYHYQPHGPGSLVCGSHLLDPGIYGPQAYRQSVAAVWDRIAGRRGDGEQYLRTQLVPLAGLGDDGRRRARRMRRRRLLSWLRGVWRRIAGGVATACPDASR